MKALFSQIKWQTLLLYRNNIINISIAVTLIYMFIIYALGDLEHIDKVVVTLILNDPTVIGYFFIALSIFGDRKGRILTAISTSPITMHQFLLSRIIVLSLIGTACSMLLVIPIKGLDFNFLEFVLASFGICFISCCLGLIMQAFADEFLKFALISVPVFLLIFGLPLLQYLGGIDLGVYKYLFFIQGAIEMLDYAVCDGPYIAIYSYASLLLLSILLYKIGLHLFVTKVVQQ